MPQSANRCRFDAQCGSHRQQSSIGLPVKHEDDDEDEDEDEDGCWVVSSICLLCNDAFTMLKQQKTLQNIRLAEIQFVYSIKKTQIKFRMKNRINNTH